MALVSDHSTPSISLVLSDRAMHLVLLYRCARPNPMLLLSLCLLKGRGNVQTQHVLPPAPAANHL